MTQTAVPAVPPESAAPVAPAAPPPPVAPSTPAAGAGPTAPTDAAVPAATDAQRPISELIDEEFRSNTETRDQSTDRTFLRERVEQVLENFIEVGGYIRSGYGRSGKGGPMVGFQAPGAGSKYRLGNEAETYGELILAKNFYLPGIFKLDEGERSGAGLKGPIARVQLRLSFFNPYSAFGSSDATSVGLPEAWASLGNVLPFAPSTEATPGSHESLGSIRSGNAPRIDRASK